MTADVPTTVANILFGLTFVGLVVAVVMFILIGRRGK